MFRKLYKRSKLILAALLALALIFSQAGTAYASAAPQEICEDNNGNWSGPNNGTGTCTYAAGSAVALDACGSNLLAYQTTYSSYAFTGDECIQTIFPTSTPTYPYGTCGDLAEGEGEEEEITPCYDDGSYATFGPGACSGNCVISTSLPKDAANHLPGDALDTLYVMVRDADGNPSTDSYTVCFANPDGDLLTIYRFVSGGWRALVTSSGDPICATASGDGAFYLGAAD
jgi:hypothetical protein